MTLGTLGNLDENGLRKSAVLLMSMPTKTAAKVASAKSLL